MCVSVTSKRDHFGLCNFQRNKPYIHRDRSRFVPLECDWRIILKRKRISVKKRWMKWAKKNMPRECMCCQRDSARISSLESNTNSLILYNYTTIFLLTFFFLLLFIVFKTSIKLFYCKSSFSLSSIYEISFYCSFI